MRDGSRCSVFLLMGFWIVAGCQTRLASDGEYFLCDQSMTCRDGYTCRDVNGNAACVPVAQAAEFPEFGVADAVSDNGSSDDEEDILEADGLDEDGLDLEVSQDARSEPCLTISPAEIAFADAIVSDEQSRSFTIENCGDGPALISRVELTGADSNVFILDDAFEDRRLPEDENLELEVTFEPQRARRYSAQLKVYVEGISEPQRIDISGDARCPPLDIEVEAEGQTLSNPSGAIFAALQEVLVSQRNDYYGAEIWRLQAKPDGSAAEVTPLGGSPPAVAWFADVVGSYELRVEGKRGEDPENYVCEASSVVDVIAKPSDSEDFYIELVWEGTADLDLHYARSSVLWNAPPDSLFAPDDEDNVTDLSSLRSEYDDWGVVGDRADDPVMRAVNRRGDGPEVIAHADMPVGVETYTILIYHDPRFPPDGASASATATVRAWRRGVLEGTWQRALSAGQLWEVLSVRKTASNTFNVNVIDSVLGGD